MHYPILHSVWNFGGVVRDASNVVQLVIHDMIGHSTKKTCTYFLCNFTLTIILILVWDELEAGESVGDLILCRGGVIFALLLL